MIEENSSWTFSNRSWMRFAKNFVAIETKGRVHSDSSVRLTLILSMSGNAKMMTVPVPRAYISAGPIIMRTAPRSFVARAMRSPVRFST